MLGRRYDVIAEIEYDPLDHDSNNDTQTMLRTITAATRLRVLELDGNRNMIVVMGRKSLSVLADK